MRRYRAVIMASAVALLAGCSTPKAADKAALEAAASARIQAIPAADPAKYQNMQDMKQWRNPYLVIRPDGVALLDVANHEERIVKTGEVLSMLADLPASAWPYGRVVAVQDQSILSSGFQHDEVQLRRNRGIVAGTLEEAHVLINWVPS
jgi:hypothetical protein